MDARLCISSMLKKIVNKITKSRIKNNGSKNWEYNGRKEKLELELKKSKCRLNTVNFKTRRYYDEDTRKNTKNNNLAVIINAFLFVWRTKSLDWEIKL